MYRLIFVCPDCKVEWEDVSDCINNDRCPICNKEIEAIEFEEIEE